MFVSSQLTNIRVLHDLSRSELAQELNISEQAVWQYENGHISPKLETILDMCRVFGVKSKFFYREHYLYDVIDDRNLAYRSKQRNNAQKVRSEKLFLEYIEKMLSDLERNVQLPPNQLLGLRDQSFDYVKILNGLEFSEEKKDTIKQIADHARQKIGLDDDNNRLMFLLEKSGAFIIERKLESDVDGYSVWTSGNRPFIVLNAHRSSQARRNFNLAHELGHLLLHYKYDVLGLDKKEYEALEKEAHYFAANFLLPLKQFEQEMSFVQKPYNPDAYLEIKQRWKVSIAALGKRAYDLGYMDYQQYRRFNAAMYKKGYKKVEPYDKTEKVLPPGKIRSLLTHLLGKQRLDLNQLFKDTHFTQEKIASFFCLETTFFKQFEPKDEHEFNTVSSLNK